MKITGPCHSDEAHGQLGRSVIFSKRGNSQIARSFHEPKKDPTMAQLEQRQLLGMITACWKQLSDSQQEIYTLQADQIYANTGIIMTGFNRFVQLAQSDLYTYLGLCGFWRMNIPGQGTVRDGSGNGFTATLGPTYPSDCPTFVASKNEMLGYGLKFDGSNDKIVGTITDRLRPNHETVMAWIYRESTVAANECYYHAYPNSFILYSESRTLDCQITNDALATRKTYKANALIDNAWHHICATYDGNVIRLYLNGLELTGTTTSGTATGELRKTSTSFNIGALAPSWIYPMKGIIDDVKVFNRVLTQQEIFDNFRLGDSPKRRR